jgi:membrane protease subunit (stomatin/prohibitin family)
MKAFTDIQSVADRKVYVDQTKEREKRIAQQVYSRARQEFAEALVGGFNHMGETHEFLASSSDLTMEEANVIAQEFLQGVREKGHRYDEVYVHLKNKDYEDGLSTFRVVLREHIK